MGQYYKLVNFDKKEFVEPWPLDCGAKLTEWSYNRAPMACALMNLVAGRWKGDRVYVVGDYADLENTLVNWYEACKEISNEVGVDAIYSYATANFKNISSEVDAEFHNWKRIYNHYTKQYIDLSKCPIEWVWWDEEIKEAVVSSFAPLGLLLAMGNGRGSGDYHGHNADLVGSWCNFTKYIEISNDKCILEGYEEFAPAFTENDSLIPYTKAEEMMNAVRKEHKHEKNH